MLALAMCAVLSAQVQETITVSRVLVDVRVTRFGGEQVTDLMPADFDVRIGGKRVIVESAEWIADGVDASSLRASEERAAEVPPALGDPPARRPGRLFVFFVQTDFARDSARTEGHMHFLPHARELVSSFGEEDRAAVFSFDSHLKFRLDFTSDHKAISEAIDNSIWIDLPPPPPAVPAPSLGPRLDRDAMRRAAHSETALLLVANALKPIPGPKTLLLLGWGLGELTFAGVQMKWQWKETRAALAAADVSIIALDTTFADGHDLEAGLKIAAEETGGFYAKTHVFPRIAIERVQRTLSGHYELALRAPDALQAGTQRLDVRVRKRGLHVLSSDSVLIRR